MDVYSDHHLHTSPLIRCLVPWASVWITNKQKFALQIFSLFNFLICCNVKFLGTSPESCVVMQFRQCRFIGVRPREFVDRKPKVEKVDGRDGQVEFEREETFRDDAGRKSSTNFLSKDRHWTTSEGSWWREKVERALKESGKKHFVDLFCRLP